MLGMTCSEISDRFSPDDTLVAATRVIRRAYSTGVVPDPDGYLHQVSYASISQELGEVLRDLVVTEQMARTLEVGLGYGLSAVFICMGITAVNRADRAHIVIDPYQHAHWNNAGLETLKRARLETTVTFYTEESQFLLPKFAAESHLFDMIFVDGDHRFDGVFLDLFFANRLIKLDGLIIVDDAHMPAVGNAINFFVKNLGWQYDPVACPGGAYAPDNISGRMAFMRRANTMDLRPWDHYESFEVFGRPE